MRRLTALVLPLALLLPLAACGQETPPQEIVARAPAATVDSSTAAVTMRMEMTDVSGAGDLSFEGTGGIDFKARRASLDMDLGDMLKGLGIDDATVSTLTDGTDIYLRSPLFDRVPALDAAGKWFKMDAASAGAAQGIDLGRLQGSGTNDPSQQLALLEGAAEDGVKEVGDAKVHGVDTTEYRAEIDLVNAAKKADAITDPEAFKTFAELFASTSIKVSVWIDDDGRVRRMRMPMPLGAQAGGGKATVTVEYDHFGDPVDVEVPAPADVLDYRRLLEATGQATGD